jgi:hypothetical protein
MNHPDYYNDQQGVGHSHLPPAPLGLGRPPNRQAGLGYLKRQKLNSDYQAPQQPDYCTSGTLQPMASLSWVGQQSGEADSDGE